MHPDSWSLVSAGSRHILKMNQKWRFQMLLQFAHCTGGLQGCYTGRVEAFWRANRAGGPIHYALYEPGGVL
jgi:hypothetical protein